VKNVAENKKYVELSWAGKYNKIDLREKMPIEKNLPFQTIETVNKTRAKRGNSLPLFPMDEVFDT